MPARSRSTTGNSWTSRGCARSSRRQHLMPTPHTVDPRPVAPRYWRSLRNESTRYSRSLGFTAIRPSCSGPGAAGPSATTRKTWHRFSPKPLKGRSVGYSPTSSLRSPTGPTKRSSSAPSRRRLGLRRSCTPLLSRPETTTTAARSATSGGNARLFGLACGRALAVAASIVAGQADLLGGDRVHPPIARGKRHACRNTATKRRRKAGRPGCRRDRSRRRSRRCISFATAPGLSWRDNHLRRRPYSVLWGS